MIFPFHLICEQVIRRIILTGAQIIRFVPGSFLDDPPPRSCVHGVRLFVRRGSVPPAPQKCSRCERIIRPPVCAHWDCRREADYPDLIAGQPYCTWHSGLADYAAGGQS